MQIAADRPQASTAIRTDLGAIFVSLELSRSTWLITSLSPGGGEKMSKHSVARVAIVAGLLERFAHLPGEGASTDGAALFRSLRSRRLDLDGFWIHRMLNAEGIESHVVDPASIATSRRRRRAKDGTGSMARLWFALCSPNKRGEPSGVFDGQGADSRGGRPPPSLPRSAKVLIAERVLHVNRIKGLLFSQGDNRIRAAPPRSTGAAGNNSRPVMGMRCRII